MATGNGKNGDAKKWYAGGLKFKCEGTSCGDCCSGKWGPGYVWLAVDEMQEIARLKGMSLEDFAMKYVRKVGTRYSLTEKPNNDCIFFDPEIGCTVYSARPQQCRSYPFWPEVVKSPETWSEEAHNCPGINCGQECDIFPASEIDRLRKSSRRKQS